MDKIDLSVLLKHKIKGKDDNGNEMFLSMPSGNVILYLKSEDKARVIGRFIATGDELHFMRLVDKKKHLFRKFWAWGINAHILDICVAVDAKLIFFTRDFVYNITAKKAKKKAQYRWYKAQGFETQAFINLNEWEKHPRTSV